MRNLQVSRGKNHALFCQISKSNLPEVLKNKKISYLSDIIMNLSYDGQNFHQHGNSSIEHYGTSLANSNDAPFFVGGSSPRTNKAEVFDISTDTWVRVDAYFFSDL